MKKTNAPISINFASVNYRLIGRLGATFAAGTVVLIVVAVGLLLQAEKYHSEEHAMRQRLQALAEAEKKLKPVMDERQELLSNLGAMTGLLEAREVSWTRLLTGVEEAFPSGIALERMEYNRNDSTLLLEGRALSPEALSAFMIGLQKSKLFLNPLLKRQSIDKGILSFHVAVNYQKPQTASGVFGTGGR